MKKIIVIIVLATFFTIGSNAQEAKGNLSFDLNFDPAAIFDAAAGPMFQMPYIKARYFFAPDMAARIGLGLLFNSETQYPDPTINDYAQTSGFGFTLAPGIEKHFGSNKFFVYVGGELPITSYSENSTSEINGTKYVAKNPDGNAYLGFGLNFIAGFDYYIFDNFYIGAELAPGLSYLKYKDSEDIDGNITEKGGKHTNFSLAASSGIRIGVRF